MADIRKKAISMRLSTADLRRVKRLAERLGVRETHVIRYAIRDLLARLSPLSDPAIKGKALVPVFLENGAELQHHFELDVAQLDTIINNGCSPTERVSADDLHMIAMTGSSPSGTYRVLSMPAAPPLRRAVADGNGNGNGNGHSNGNGHANGNGHGETRTDGLETSEQEASPLRRYLYEKYLYAQISDAVPAAVRED